jgi:hypothetical protein
VTAVPGPQTALVALPAEIDVSNGSLVEAALTGRQMVLAADARGSTLCDGAVMTAPAGDHHRAVATGAQLPGGGSQRCADDEYLAEGVDTAHGHPGPARQLVTHQRPAAAMSGSVFTAGVTQPHECKLPKKKRGPGGHSNRPGPSPVSTI